MRVFLCNILVGIALSLLLINFAGLARGANVWPKPENFGVRAGHKQFEGDKALLKKKKDEDDFTFAERMNGFVHAHTTHFLFDANRLDNIEVMAVPLEWCWPLWLRGLLSVFAGERFVVEFCDAEKGLARGFGYCSQRALILEDILARNSLRARTTELYGHVVCALSSGGREIVLDPDYGVLIPHSLLYLHRHPEALRLYMAGEDALKLGPYYASDKWLERAKAPYPCFSNTEIILLKIAAWLLPLLLLAAGLLGRRPCRKT